MTLPTLREAQKRHYDYYVGLYDSGIKMSAPDRQQFEHALDREIEWEYNAIARLELQRYELMEELIDPDTPSERFDQIGVLMRGIHAEIETLGASQIRNINRIPYKAKQDEAFKRMNEFDRRLDTTEEPDETSTL